MAQPRVAERLPARPVRRRRYTAQRGMTLIEVIVAVALLATGVVGLASGFATAEHIATVNQDQAQLEVVMRQLSDWTRSSSSTTCAGAATQCPNLPYVLCATSSSYQPDIALAVSSGAVTPGAGITPSIQLVTLSTGGTRTGAGSSTPVWVDPQQTCSLPTSTSCTATTHASCVGDWGAQEIRVQVANSSRSLTRTVWKSNGW
ncbi:MAG: prepilin-type N-terminal cleavage/methylation domain-containing protein [Candidatus Dormibacteraeota bacterium]|nr:prepilin-type N-terminal cleavage/methylation domain-containing protein [Candidatus Dormibacteraeota bacterium]